jgi:protein involved in plasmid replication-relaxation
MRNKDAELLYFVREFRLVTERQLKELTGRQTLWRRLPVLVAQKQLYRRRRNVYEPFVYAAYNITDRKDFEHDLIITDIHIALYKSGKLIEWTQPKQKLKGELNEDAYCVISAGARELHCFMEADNNSEPDWQIREKIERYLNHYRKIGKLFRVLFVTPDQRRVEQLLRASQRMIPKELSLMFLFASLTDLRRGCSAAVCFVCHETKLTSIIPGLSGSV